MSAPTTNSDGKQVFKPETGIYYKPGLNDRESYAGVIAALQDFEISKGRSTQSYPANWGGIISAIQNMTDAQFEPGSDAGTNPGDGTIDPDTGDWIQTTPPPEGTLWFDTRQGRLFVYVSDAWVQTNGGDGFPVITASSNQPTFPGGIPAPGQFWYDVTTGSLYIHDGQFVDSNGNIVTPDTPGATPLWRLINSVSSASFNTATLINNGSFTNTTYNFVLDLVANGFVNQDDINQWLVAAVGALDTEAGQTDVIALTEPSTAAEGEVWFDAANQVLKIYQNGAWKDCLTPEVTSSDITQLSALITGEIANRSQDIQVLSNAVQSALDSHTDDISALNSDVNTLESTVNAIPGTYETKADSLTLKANLENQINNITIAPPDLSCYALCSTVDALEAIVNSLPTQASLNSVSANIPDVSTFVNQSHIDFTVTNALNDYMPKTGGTFTNGLAIHRSSGYAIDLGGSATYSQQALRLTSNNPDGTSHVSFGANNEFWELAWDLDTKEDLCVRANGNKVFSANKDGIATNKLLIGDFTPNTVEGRGINNTVDVGATLASLISDVNVLKGQPASSTYIAPDDTALSLLQQKVAALETGTGQISIDLGNLQSNAAGDGVDIDALESGFVTLETKVNALESGFVTLETKVNALEGQPRIHYSDDAPTTATDGDLWFQSNTMRLLVRHSNAWINPDRVEDETHTHTSSSSTVDADLEGIKRDLTALNATVANLNNNDFDLQGSLFNAISGATTFNELKIRLMTALST